MRDARALCQTVARLQQERDDVGFLLTGPENIIREKPDHIVDLQTEVLPLDNPTSVGAFLREWRPDLAVVSRKPLPPRLSQNAAEKMPLILVNFDGSGGTAGPWQKVLGAERRVLRQFSHILVPDEEVAQAVRRSGAETSRVEVTGWLQECMPPLPCDQSEHDRLSAFLGGRPLWLAAGTVADEEPEILRAHRQVSRLSHRLLLVLLPDDPKRGARLAGHLVSEGWAVALRSEGDLPVDDAQIYIADKPDEFGLWYRLAPLSFMGASLVRGPGRDPFEAASLGSAVLSGPNVQGFRDAYERLGIAQAAKLVRNADQLAKAVEALLAPHHAAAMAHAAWELASRGAEVTDRLIDLVITSLDDRGL